MKTEKITKWATYESIRNHSAIAFFAQGANGSLLTWEEYDSAGAGEALYYLQSGTTTDDIVNHFACVDTDADTVSAEWTEYSNEDILFTETQNWPICDGFWHLPALVKAMIAEAAALSGDLVDLSEQVEAVDKVLDMVSFDALKRYMDIRHFEKFAQILCNTIGAAFDAERMAAELEKIGQTLYMFKWFTAYYYTKNESPEEDDKYGTEEDFDYITVSCELYESNAPENAEIAAECLLDSDLKITETEQNGRHVSITIEPI